MRIVKILLVLLALILLPTGCGTPRNNRNEIPTLKVALLPIVDSLPMYVAQQDGLFEKNGIKVEFIPVASAPERDQLLVSKQADGMINEAISTFFFNRLDTQIQIVRYALRPTEKAGHFFILASAKSGFTSPEQLKLVAIGVSQGTIIEYVTFRLLEQAGLRESDIKTIAVPRMPDRLALLNSGELSAAVLPDPLAALAIQQGAKVIMDDSEYPQYGFSVISFRKEVIDKNPQAIKAFLASIEEATTLINANPEKYFNILSEQKLVPDPLLESYSLPPYPLAGLPTEAEWNDALSWTKEMGLIDTDVAYQKSVTSKFLP
jgi:NitT/TauT family transport system substrate-binding protein